MATLFCVRFLSVTAAISVTTGKLTLSSHVLLMALHLSVPIGSALGPHVRLVSRVHSIPDPVSPVHLFFRRRSVPAHTILTASRPVPARLGQLTGRRRRCRLLIGRELMTHSARRPLGPDRLAGRPPLPAELCARAAGTLRSVCGSGGLRRSVWVGWTAPRLGVSVCRPQQARGPGE